MGYNSELKFEKDLIDYLCSGQIGEQNGVYKSKLWTYEKHIKTTDQLWDNFKKILEQHNQDKLDQPLSDIEFAQVKKEIESLTTPYKAGQFLYGTNGVSELEVDLDDGRHVFLQVFDQRQIGAGDTVYQIVNQVERPAKITGKMDRRFDVTMLINGLPIIQIELKSDKKPVSDAFNQMEQYLHENQYTDIFSTLQILIGMTPNNGKYMACTTPERFNKDFIFKWQRESDNTDVRQWKEFADCMLTIPAAHQMATNYMVLDGTPNKESIKVMRPYQVYATRKVLNGLKNTDFELGCNKVGYIWHTTGSGKTITSFKTAWLASRLPGIDKVVFVVDRKALTKQTSSAYKAYDPDNDGVSEGMIRDTSSTYDLSRKLKTKDNHIIITSVQKLEHLVKRPSFKSPDKNIVFIVDEAHRSTEGDAFEMIQKAFKRAAWVGYTGTPTFDQKGITTEDVFGKPLHQYTIREAIADKNVLGFKVDFETTIDFDHIDKDSLRKYLKEMYPEWSEDKINDKVENFTVADLDDTLGPTFYDYNQEHIEIVVKDIFDKWRNRSNEGRYNAILTTHVAGTKASTPMAMQYYKEFQRVNATKDPKDRLKVAVNFSANASNNDSMLQTNEALFEAISDYNKTFGTHFDMTTVDEYNDDVISRLNRTNPDKQYLDLVIVVERLLTGFDAPQLNTLYVDRMLKGALLIQAYSRTNRIEDLQNKPFGRIVNYRFPTKSEALMNEALALYSNKNAANLSSGEQKKLIEDDDIIEKSYSEVLNKVKDTVQELREMTGGFNHIPHSEAAQEEMLEKLREYNAGLAKLKQFEDYDYDNPDALIEDLGMSEDEEKTLTTTLTQELKEAVAKAKKIPVFEVELKITHVKDIRVNYDYLTKLIEDLMNQVYEEKMKEAQETKEKIDKFTSGLEDRSLAKKIRSAVNAIINRDYPTENDNVIYPVKLTESLDIIDKASTKDEDRDLYLFRTKWGLAERVKNSQLRNLMEFHIYGSKDLDDTGALTSILKIGTADYKKYSLDPEIQGLTKIKYRNALREAIYAKADEMVLDD